MSTVYVVRPDVRGVYYYDGWGIEHAQMTTPMIDTFSVEQPFLQTTVERCIVRPNSVCEHGWFCTDNRDVAAMVNELRGERDAVVAWLQELSASSLNHDPVEELQYAARSIKRGEHRREEGR